MILTAITADSPMPQGHSVRRIKPMVGRILAGMSAAFDRIYGENVRVSIPPEHLLKVSLLMALFSVGRKHQFSACLGYDLLFEQRMSQDGGFLVQHLGVG